MAGNGGAISWPVPSGSTIWQLAHQTRASTFPRSGSPEASANDGKSATRAAASKKNLASGLKTQRTGAKSRGGVWLDKNRVIPGSMSDLAVQIDWLSLPGLAASSLM